jgi:Cu-Zn family superoxide dismutase
MKKFTYLISAVFIYVFLVSGCENKKADEEGEMPGNSLSVDTTMEQTAIAMLAPTKDSKVSGTITFTRNDEGVKVVADIQGLTPGKHGIHIHENGDCSAPDASSAGDHFATLNQTHGSPEDSSRHEGDMGNIVADNEGVAHLEYTDLHMSFDGDKSIIGKAVVVHEKEDDLKSQPSGNSGKRLACGVIELGDIISADDPDEE